MDIFLQVVVFLGSWLIMTWGVFEIIAGAKAEVPSKLQICIGVNWLYIGIMWLVLALTA